jgi:hypothetical protein
MEIPVSPPQAGAMKAPASLPWILWMASASCSAQTLVIGLYDYSDLSAKETVRLTETAGLALAHSGIDVVWRHCRGVLAVTAGTTCEQKMQDNEIVMRIEPGGPRSSDDDRTLHLGHATVTAEGGSYASVFVPAVRAQAAEFGVTFDLLMGYAVAHEASHCLLGPGHSHAGLMRAAWNRKDSAAMLQGGLHLTKPEARKAVARLAQAELAATVPGNSKTPASGVRFTVRLYDYVNLPASERSDLTTNAKRILGQRG